MDVFQFDALLIDHYQSDLDKAGIDLRVSCSVFDYEDEALR